MHARSSSYPKDATYLKLVIKRNLLNFVAADPDIPSFELLMSLFLMKKGPHTHYHSDIVI